LIVRQEKAAIEDMKRHLLERQHLVFRREHMLHSVMHAQRTLQIAQARQEAQRCGSKT
jgi:fatty acid-binding protein DegV